MNILHKMLKPLIKKLVLGKLRDVATSKYIVDLINSKLDVPKLSEEEESKLITAIILALFTATETAIERI